jgi:tetratricopeptide (TPR) repeat protein/glycosyltransferase involved in cell wall biosynthesis
MARRTRSAHRTAYSSAAPVKTAREIFAEAVQHHVAGRIVEAEASYRRVLVQEPRFAEALNNLGVLVRRHDAHAAHSAFEAAAAARPDYVEALVNLGLSWNERGARDAAIESFRAAIAVSPNHGQALNDLGAALRARGDLDEALAVSRRAVAVLPNDAATHSNLGNVLLEKGHLDEARACYERALAIRPDYPEALNNLGSAYRALREYDKAVPLFFRALDLRPGFLDAMHNLALGIPPSLPVAARIEPRLRAEVARLPENPAALAALCVYLQETNRFAEARDAARAVVRLDEDNADAWTVLGICAAEAGALREAIACYDRARAARPRSPVTRWNRAIALLALGEYDEGWREYESRWELVQQALDRRLFATPEWDGSSLDGRTILLYTEQGLGDAIQFARFGQELKRRWRARIIVECASPLVSLFQSCGWVDGVIARGTARPPFDTHAPLLSLARILGARLDNLPTDPAFPVVDRPIANRITKTAGRVDVGIVWGGRAPNPALARRSIDLEQLAPLAAIPGVQLHSLQLGDTTGQLERSSFRASVNDLAPHISDFVDTATAIAALDLVITIDTSVAHLAGALGTPVWILLMQNADWRWLLDRTDSPWYPSARLFRQTTAGDWSSAIEQVTTALHRYAVEQGGATTPVQPMRADAAATTQLPARQRRSDGEPRFTLTVPLAALNGDAEFATYSTELAGDGVDPEARAFLDSVLGAEDVVIDVGAGWGFTALGAATAPTTPALVVALVESSADAQVIASGARTALACAPMRVHVRGDAGETGIDALIEKYAPVAPRVCVRVREPGAVVPVLAEAAAALTGGRVSAVVWNAAHRPELELTDTLALEMLSSFGFDHFAMAQDDDGPVLVPLSAVPDARTIFSLCVGGDAPVEPTSATLPVVGFDWELGATSGWGVYGLNLARRLIESGAALPAPLLPPALVGIDAAARSSLAPVLAAHAEFRGAVATHDGQVVRVPFVMLRALGNGLHLSPDSRTIDASRNVGVVFFESTHLDAGAIARARRFDRIVAGSTWNADLLRARGLDNVVTVLQGVDASVFRPRGARRRHDRFTIFSGGKLEYRKGQDIVVAAFREFHRRHPESRLMIAWHNHWPQTMNEIVTAGHVRGIPVIQQTGQADMTGWLAANGIPSDAVIDLGLRGNADMGALLAEADVALFTNRAEGGTNLVAMECLASGLPSILSANTGHLDLIDDARCYPLRAQSAARPTASFTGVDGWGESSIEEVVEALERVYADAGEAERRAAHAAAWMQHLTWDRQIDALTAAIGDLL